MSLWLLVFPFVKTWSSSVVKFQHALVLTGRLQLRHPGDFYRLECPRVWVTHVQQVFIGGGAPLEGWHLVPCWPTSSNHAIVTIHPIGCHLHRKNRIIRIMFHSHGEDINSSMTVKGLSRDNREQFSEKNKKPSCQFLHVAAALRHQMDMFHWLGSGRSGLRWHSLHWQVDHSLHTLTVDRS